MTLIGCAEIFFWLYAGDALGHHLHTIVTPALATAAALRILDFYRRKG